MPASFAVVVVFGPGAFAVEVVGLEGDFGADEVVKFDVGSRPIDVMDAVELLVELLNPVGTLFCMPVMLPVCKLLPPPVAAPFLAPVPLAVPSAVPSAVPPAAPPIVWVTSTMELTVVSALAPPSGGIRKLTGRHLPSLGPKYRFQKSGLASHSIKYVDRPRARVRFGHIVNPLVNIAPAFDTSVRILESAMVHLPAVVHQTGIED
jgi:hypothetical protein